MTCRDARSRKTSIAGTRRRLAGTGVTAVGLAVAISLAPLTGCSDTADGDMTGVPSNLTVGSSGSADYASIGEAVLAAAPGSTIVVEAGDYTESLLITKSLTILGAGTGTVIAFPDGGLPDSAVIEIRDATDVRIESLVVRASRTDVDGVRVRDAIRVVLDSLVAESNSQDGIDIKRSQEVSIHMCRLEGNGADGIQVDEGSDGVTITACLATSNVVDGIKIRSSANVLVDGCESTSNGDDGIIVRDSTGVRLTGNTATGNADWGISVVSSPDTILDTNTASGNAGGQIRCEPTACAGPAPRLLSRTPKA